MASYSVSISGSSNDTNLILSSANGVINIDGLDNSQNLASDLLGTTGPPGPPGPPGDVTNMLSIADVNQLIQTALLTYQQSTPEYKLQLLTNKVKELTNVDITPYIYDPNYIVYGIMNLRVTGGVPIEETKAFVKSHSVNNLVGDGNDSVFNVWMYNPDVSDSYGNLGMEIHVVKTSAITLDGSGNVSEYAMTSRIPVAAPDIDGYSWAGAMSFFQVVELFGGVDMFRFLQPPDLPIKAAILSQNLSALAGKLVNTTNSSIAGYVAPNQPVSLYDFAPLGIQNLELLGYAKAPSINSSAQLKLDSIVNKVNELTGVDLTKYIYDHQYVAYLITNPRFEQSYLDNSLDEIKAWTNSLSTGFTSPDLDASSVYFHAWFDLSGTAAELTVYSANNILLDANGEFSALSHQNTWMAPAADYNGYSWPGTSSFGQTAQIGLSFDTSINGVARIRLSQYPSDAEIKFWNSGSGWAAGNANATIDDASLVDFNLDSATLLGMSKKYIPPRKVISRLEQIDPSFSLSNLDIDINESSLSLTGDQRLVFIEFDFSNGSVIDISDRNWQIEFRQIANDISSVQFWTCYFNSDYTKFYEMYKVNSKADHYQTFTELFAKFAQVTSPSTGNSLTIQDWYYFARPTVDLTNANDVTFLPRYSELSSDSQNVVTYAFGLSDANYNQLSWPQLFGYGGQVTTESI